MEVDELRAPWGEHEDEDYWSYEAEHEAMRHCSEHGLKQISPYKAYKKGHGLKGKSQGKGNLYGKGWQNGQGWTLGNSKDWQNFDCKSNDSKGRSGQDVKGKG